MYRSAEEKKGRDATEPPDGGGGKELTWQVDTAIPLASTGTTAPSIVLQRNGVISIAPTVVAVVISTLSATFPLAM